MKPTFALVAHAPPSAFGTLSHVGPMATCMEDVALFLDAIAFPHKMDPHSLYPGLPDKEPFPRNSYFRSIGDGVRGMKIAFSMNLGGYVPYVDPRIEKCIREAANVFQKLGATVEWIDDLVDPSTGKHVLPFRNAEFTNLYRIFKTMWCTGAANLVQLKFEPKNLELVDPGLRAIAEIGNKLTAIDVARAEFERTTMCRMMNDFHEKYDLLCTPTLPLPPFLAEWEVPKHDEHFSSGEVAGQRQRHDKKEVRQTNADFQDSDRQRWWTWTPFTYPFNLTKQPCCSVPAGFSDTWQDAKESPTATEESYMESFPVGLHIVGAVYQESKVLRAAYAFEQETGHQKLIMSRLRNQR